MFVCDTVRAHQLVNINKAKGRFCCRYCLVDTGVNANVRCADRDYAKGLQLLERMPNAKPGKNQGCKLYYRGTYPQSVDINKDTPMDTLHTLELGIIEAVWSVTGEHMTDREKTSFRAAWSFACFSGCLTRLWSSPLNPAKQYDGSEWKA